MHTHIVHHRSIWFDRGLTGLSNFHTHTIALGHAITAQSHSRLVHHCISLWATSYLIYCLICDVWLCNFSFSSALLSACLPACLLARMPAFRLFWNKSCLRIVPNSLVFASWRIHTLSVWWAVQLNAYAVPIWGKNEWPGNKRPSGVKSGRDVEESRCWLL